MKPENIYSQLHQAALDNKAGRILLSAEAQTGLAEWFRTRGFDVELFRTTGITADPLACHPDMFMCKMGAAPDADTISYFAQNDISLSPDYPDDIAFNAACTGRYFIHTHKYTAPVLLKRAEASGMTLVDVRQGYAKCSTVVVDDCSVITYDRGIAKACKASGMDVLTVCPGYIILPGYNTGFIGGASGRVDDTVIFNGDLSSHPDFRAMTDFIERRGLEVKWFREWPLTDIGSIIQIQ